MKSKLYTLTERSIGLLEELSDNTGYSRSELVDIAIMVLHHQGIEPKPVSNERAIDRLYQRLHEIGVTFRSFCDTHNVDRESMWAYCRSIDKGSRIWPAPSAMQRWRDKNAGAVYRTRNQYIDDIIYKQFGKL